jgi:hypothetical protein
MMLTILRGESQRAFVERTLRERGEISAFDAMYRLADDTGHERGVTRLAAVIGDLRERGWDIETRGLPGEQATYLLRRAANGDRPPTSPWRCSTCSSPPRAEPEPWLGGFGRARCPSCGEIRMFRRVA